MPDSLAAEVARTEVEAVVRQGFGSDMSLDVHQEEGAVGLLAWVAAAGPEEWHIGGWEEHEEVLGGACCCCCCYATARGLNEAQRDWRGEMAPGSGHTPGLARIALDGSGSQQELVRTHQAARMPSLEIEPDEKQVGARVDFAIAAA